MSEAAAAVVVDGGGAMDEAAWAGAAVAQRRRRVDAGSVKVTERDVELLRLLGEMYALSQLQLRRLLGCSESRAHRVRRRWQHAGWIEAALILAAEPVVLWPMREGLRVAGLGGYRLWRPSPQRVGHVLRVADVRLVVAERQPQARWVAERELARVAGSDVGPVTSSSLASHRPDAVVELEGRRAAVEVELTSKGKERARQIMRVLLERYDAAWYFAAPRPAGVLGQVAGALRVGDRVRVYDLHGSLLWP